MNSKYLCQRLASIKEKKFKRYVELQNKCKLSTGLRDTLISYCEETKVIKPNVQNVIDHLKHNSYPGTSEICELILPGYEKHVDKREKHNLLIAEDIAKYSDKLDKEIEKILDEVMFNGTDVTELIKKFEGM